MSTTVNKVYKINGEQTIKILSVLDLYPIIETEPFYSVLSSQLQENNFLDLPTIFQIKKFLLSSLPRQKSVHLLKDFDSFVEEYTVKDEEEIKQK